MQEVGVSGLHAKRRIQRLNQRVEVGLEEEWDPGGSKVMFCSTAVKARRKLTKRWNTCACIRRDVLSRKTPLLTDNYYPGERPGATCSCTIHSTKPPTLKTVPKYQNAFSPSLSFRRLTFAYITHNTSLYRIGVNPSTLFNGLISGTSIRRRRLDEQSGLLEEHL